MKKILVDIYLAFNLGDDLFLDVLAKRYPTAEITVLFPGNNYNTFFNNYKNVKKFPYNFKDKVLRRLGFNNVLTNYNKMAHEYDALLFLGGGIFREESYAKSLLNYRNDIAASFIGLNKKIYFLGCSFGPYTSKEFFNGYYKLFKQCDDICFRDTYSSNLFKELNNVRCAPDILWDLKVELKEKKENIIGYSIINPKHKFGLENYYETYVNCTSKAIIANIDNGLKVYLLSFCEQEGDLITITEILKRIPIEKQQEILVFNYSGNISEMLDSLSKLKYLVAARFHAVILGFLNKSKVIPIIYSNKTKNMLNDINFSGNSIEFSNLKTLEEFDLTKHQKDVNSCPQNSKQHFKKLDVFLRSNKGT